MAQNAQGSTCLDALQDLHQPPDEHVTGLRYLNIYPASLLPSLLAGIHAGRAGQKWKPGHPWAGSGLSKHMAGLCRGQETHAMDAALPSFKAVMSKHICARGWVHGHGFS